MTKAAYGANRSRIEIHGTASIREKRELPCQIDIDINHQPGWKATVTGKFYEIESYGIAGSLGFCEFDREELIDHLEWLLDRVKRMG